MPKYSQCAECESSFPGSIVPAHTFNGAMCPGSPDRPNVWREYDSAAEWCAIRKIAGKDGDPLPNLLSAECKAEIDKDPEAFQDRIKATAYAIAMHGVQPE